MKTPFSILIAVSFLLLFSQCKTAEETADAYGNFETEETMIAAEGNGRLLQFSVQEGQKLEAGMLVGVIDTSQLHLQKQQLLAKARAIRSKSPDVASQLAVFNQQIETSQEQLKILYKEKTRVENLLKADAATPKQLDDINAQIDVLNKQVGVVESQSKAQKKALGIQGNAILQEAIAVQTQIAQIEDQIGKCHVRNPLSGIVTGSYAEEAEVVGFGKPLYKLADLSTMTMRAYVSGDQLVNVKVGQKVTVKVDAPDETYKDYEGTVTWISSEAEFTPKIIQTKKDRVNLVYAMKIDVPNDGSLKMGMPGEVVF